MVIAMATVMPMDPLPLSSYAFVKMGCVYAGIFLAILGRGPRAFQIGKISAVNLLIEKFSKCNFCSIQKQISYYTYYCH